MRKFHESQLQFDLPALDEVGEDAEARAITFEEARVISEGARGAWERRIVQDGERVLRRSDEGEEDRGNPVYGDYLRLREWGWPWRIATFMAWSAAPKGRRWPRTLQELAIEVLGLRSTRTIYNWRSKFPAIDSVVAMLQAAPLFEHRREVIEALVESAGTPDYKNFNDRKLFLEMTGDYTPRSQVEVGRKASGGVEEMSDEELRAWLTGAAANPEDEEEKEVGDWLDTARPHDDIDEREGRNAGE